MARKSVVGGSPRGGRWLPPRGGLWPVALPAVAGGQIEVLLRGIATVKVDGSATAIAAGDALVLSGVKLDKAVAGEGIVAQSLVAVTTDTTSKVYVLPRF